jgi:hypothetical protein
VCTGVGITQSVKRLTTDWTVPGSNAGGGGGEISALVQTGPEAHPVSYTMGTGSFQGVKQPGHDVHPPLSSAEVEGRVQLYICTPSGPSWPV